MVNPASFVTHVPMVLSVQMVRAGVGGVIVINPSPLARSLSED